jgi:hypothetical protein
MAFNLQHFNLSDDYAASVQADFTNEFNVDNYTSKVEAEFISPLQNYDAEEDSDNEESNECDISWGKDEQERDRGRKERSPNAYQYVFGNVYESNWYNKFLEPSVREWAYYLSSRDRYREFRSLFRMPLKKIDDLVSLFLKNGWVHQTKHCKSKDKMMTKLELRILDLLKVLGHNAPFRTLKSDTNILDKEHRNFFTEFIHRMYSVRDNYTGYPSTGEELKNVMDRYNQNYLPGCGGSVDVVHVKWSNCPSGNVNRANGKKGYPSLVFEDVTGFDCQILGVSSAHFGTQNDKHIVRTDPTINIIRTGWYQNVVWKWYDGHGNEREDTGVYLICDGGYVH